jgi:hypothetical protein
MQKINTENMYKCLQLEKIKRILEIPALAKNQVDWEILAFAENQADLWNPCAAKKSGGFTKSLCLRKIRRVIESLWALKSPRLVKNLRLKKKQWDWKSWRPAYGLGSAESPAADFLLVWLKSSCCPAFIDGPFPYCTGPPCQEMAKIHAATKSQAAVWNFTNSCQITKILTRLQVSYHWTEKSYMITVAVQYQPPYSQPQN